MNAAKLAARRLVRLAALELNARKESSSRARALRVLISARVTWW